MPVAAIEQHGPHLPLNVDTTLVDGVVAATLAHLPTDLPILFLPTQSVGFSPEHAAFAGTLTLKAQTVIALWTAATTATAAGLTIIQQLGGSLNSSVCPNLSGNG